MSPRPAQAAIALPLLALVVAALVGAAAPQRSASTLSPIYGVGLPKEYRDWPLVAPADEAAPLNELRAVVANPVALAAYRSGQRPFPDGSVLVKLAWAHEASPDFPPASVPGAPTTVQVMVKDRRRYAATGGWGFGRFVGGRPVDRQQHEACFACHAAHVKDRDYVFTRYAP